MDKSKLKIIMIHGNGGGSSENFWMPSVARDLEKLGYQVINQTFPDNEIAHESIWLPFLKDTLKADESTIIIGHSSGGVAAMRFAEKNKIYGSAIIGVNYTDLGDPTETESGYYNHPWDWQTIKKNQNWILQFDSTDDPYIPISEPRFIHDQLQSDYVEYPDKGHFMIPEFPELISAIKAKLS